MKTDNLIELKLENQILKNILHTDSVTGLPNMLLYEKDIKKTVNPIAIVVDIDAFKEINEYYGREIGDFVLKAVAQIIQTYADVKNMKTYRVGSDEFLLLGSGVLDIEKYEMIAQEMAKLLKANEICIPSLDDYIVIDSTIGFCLEEDDVLNKAIMALDYAKKTQKDFACYLHTMQRKSRYKERQKYARLIKEALDYDKVMPYYQPIFDRVGDICKYEVLSRIENIKSGVISPYLFLGVSKKVRLYTSIVKRIIDKSFSEISKTNNLISINLLARDMMDGDISNYIIEKIKEYGIAKQVIIEILEEESIENLPRVESFIDRVKWLGVRIAIDDFGTGYSSFSYLMKLKPDYLKIDGSIIKNIDKDKDAEAIIRAIVSFAKALHIKTIAEFVYSKEVYEKCYELGVDEFQGFYLGKPLPNLIHYPLSKRYIK